MARTGDSFPDLCVLSLLSNRTSFQISGKHIASPDIVATFTGRGILVFSFGNHDYEMVQKYAYNVYSVGADKAIEQPGCRDAIMPYQEYLDKCQRPKRTWSKAFRHAMREAQMIESGELVIDESTLILVGICDGVDEC